MLQHDVAGGGTHTYELGRYKFDSGLHYTVSWSSWLLWLAAGLSHLFLCVSRFVRVCRSQIDCTEKATRQFCREGFSIA